MEGGRMTSGAGGVVLREVRRLFETGTVLGMSEAQLLDRFVARRDEAAFEALLTRHGPMVLGVCRHVLRDPHAVEDAFQATFLVMVRKAGAIRRGEALGPWLYKVAHRVAVRANVDAGRRRAQAIPLTDAETGREDGPMNHEIRALLHDEVGRLPAKYRDPVVLCYLEGLSHDAAARELRWPIGT